MASRPSALTRSSISSRERLSYTGSKTPMGILRIEAILACAEPDSGALPGVFADVPDFEADAVVGKLAANRLPPPAARNALRSNAHDLPLLFIRFSSSQNKTAAQTP